MLVGIYKVFVTNFKSLLKVLHEANLKFLKIIFMIIANFHLRNGAVMWRINYMADPSPRGMANSCGIMVNYRYFLDATEFNSRNYIEHYNIKASDTVIHLAEEAEKLFINAKEIGK